MLKKRPIYPASGTVLSACLVLNVRCSKSEKSKAKTNTTINEIVANVNGRQAKKRMSPNPILSFKNLFFVTSAAYKALTSKISKINTRLIAVLIIAGINPTYLICKTQAKTATRGYRNQYTNLSFVSW